jgi:hypothetical protein
MQNLELIFYSENLSKGTKITTTPIHIKNWLNENKESK